MLMDVCSPVSLEVQPRLLATVEVISFAYSVITYQLLLGGLSLMRKQSLLVALSIGLLFAATSQASFLVQVDVDGADDGPITFHPNFSFGNGGTTASTSSHSSAVGLAEGDSIFGGDGTPSDQYVITYTPGTDGDNLALAAGTALNDDGDLASGVTAGGSGDYDIYVTWPFTSNTSGGGSLFVLTDDMANTLFSVPFDQNGGDAGTGNEWIKIGSANLDASTTYTLTQTTQDSSFVSQRLEGVLFEAAIPEPSSLALAVLCGLSVLVRRK